MAFKKPVQFAQFQEEYPEAYHRVEQWSYDNLYWKNSVKVTVFAYRSKADADHNDQLGIAALQTGEAVPKDKMIGPVGQSTFTLGLLDFGSKDDLTMGKTYELLSKMDEWLEAEEA